MSPDLTHGLTALAAYGVVAVTSTLAWSRMFATSRGVVVCVAVAVTAVAVAASIRSPRATVWRAAAGGGALLALAAVVAVPLSGVGSPSPAAVAQVVRWLPTMIPATLERGLPADSHGEPLLLAMVLTWAATAIGAELVRRSRWRAAALAAPTALVVAALALGAPRRSEPLAVAVPYALGALLFLAVTGRGDGRSSSLRRSVVTSWRQVVALALVVLTAISIGSILPWADGASPTLQRAPAFDARRVVSPLATVYPQRSASAPAVLFAVRGAPRSIDRISLATLDEFDGTTWSSGAEYRPVGEHTPRDARPDHLLETASLTIEIAELDGPWLPHAGRTARIGLRGVQADEPSGNLVLPEGVYGGLTYELTVSTPRSDARQELVRSDPLVPPGPEMVELPTGPATDDASLDDLPDGLRPCSVDDVRETARQWTDGITAAGGAEVVKLAEVSAIERRLNEEFGRSEQDDPYGPGHSIADLCKVLGIGPSATARPADDEQYAAVMATMVRSLDIPARVVVGYRLPEQETSGERVVTEHDVTAWTEVFLGGAGWLTFDPTPGSELPSEQRVNTITSQQPTPVPTAPPTTAPPPDPTPTTVPPSSVPPDRESDAQVVGVVVVASCALALMLAAGVLLVVGALKRRRRARRRGAGRPNDVVAGAWSETLDVLRDRGFRPSSELTAREVALAAVEATGATEIRRPMLSLSRLFGRANYSAALMDDEWSRRSWALADEVERQLDRASTRRARWRARFSLRSLRNRSE